MGDAEVTFKDESDELVKLPAAKLPECPKVAGTGGWGGMFFLLKNHTHKIFRNPQR